MENYNTSIAITHFAQKGVWNINFMAILDTLRHQNRTQEGKAQC